MPNQDNILDEFCKAIQCPGFHRVTFDCMMDHRCIKSTKEFHKLLKDNGYLIVKEK